MGKERPGLLRNRRGKEREHSRKTERENEVLMSGDDQIAQARKVRDSLLRQWPGK